LLSFVAFVFANFLATIAFLIVSYTLIRSLLVPTLPDFMASSTPVLNNRRLGAVMTPPVFRVVAHDAHH